MIILKTEIGDKCRETITNEKKQMEYMYHIENFKYTADRKVLFYLYCCN